MKSMNDIGSEIFNLINQKNNAQDNTDREKLDSKIRTLQWVLED